MQKHGVSPDHLTYVILLQACGVLSEKEGTLIQGKSNAAICLEIGQALHMVAQNMGYSACIQVVNTLINMYGKCGSVKQAEEVFNQLTELDIVTWNVMLSALAENAHGDKALLLFRKMQLKHLNINEITLMSILQACSETGSLDVCHNLHFDIISNGLDNISHLMACLVTAYGSCASAIDASATFDDVTEPNIVTWNAFISSHTLDGNTIGTFYMFENLKLLAIKPDKVSFISVLSACSQSGFLSTGLEYFQSMDMDISERRHYNIMIDMYGRAGDFRMIENIYRKMPVKPDLTIWLSILGACCVHNNPELAKEAFQQAVHMYPEHASTYVLMSNICADVYSIVEESVYFCETSITNG